MRPTLVMLTMVGLIIAACQPTPAPGEPTWTPAPTRTPRPTATLVLPTDTPTPTITVTPYPTPHLPTPGVYTRLAVPTEDVCFRSIREDLVESEYAPAHIRLDSLLFQVSNRLDFLVDEFYVREFQKASREAGDLLIVPCTRTGHGLLMRQVEAMQLMFSAAQNGDMTGVQQGIDNAEAASATYYLWAIGMRPYLPVPLH